MRRAELQVVFIGYQNLKLLFRYGGIRFKKFLGTQVPVTTGGFEPWTS